MRTRISLAVTALAISSAGLYVHASQAQTDRFLFSCSVFSSATTETDLRLRFGAANVTAGSVPDLLKGAEGDRTQGTILFAQDADARVEAGWTDPIERHHLGWVRVFGAHSRWRTPGGITLGADLKTLEKLNGGPFRLTGLATDVQGTVLSWAGGRLDGQDSKGCHIGVRLRDEGPGNSASAAALGRQITGDRPFSSGHPAFQALNPTVYELVIGFVRPALPGAAPLSGNMRDSRQ